ncbi:hypothetical protein [Planococcus beigongshangi]|uniref:hypothetical protein n=1 Tax=Planococcus beigongshangi TaxID=2782536 RepID=UPI00193B6549|nr:hypothetical protein [Planococcus beigongshangi]
MKKILLLLLCLALLFGCSSQISQEEAEQIALEQAEEANYESPALWQRFDAKTHLVSHYSKTYEKDVESWGVYLDTADNPKELNSPALLYYISKETGEVIDVIVGAVSNE